MTETTRRERTFTPLTLTRDGAVSTRMRAGCVTFERDDYRTHRVEAADFSKYGRDDLIAWIAQALAEGETVILHPDSQTYPTDERRP